MTLFNISLPCLTLFRPGFFSRLVTRGGGGLRRPPFIIKKPPDHLNCTAHFQHVGKLDWQNDVIWRHYDVILINLLAESVNVSPRNGKNGGFLTKSGSLISVIYHDDIIILLLKKSLELRKSWQKRFVYKRMLRKQKNLQSVEILMTPAKDSTGLKRVSNKTRD